jgi:hypothetical protein
LVQEKPNEELADIVTTRMQKIDGIESMETLIVLRVCLHVHLEGVFSGVK